MDAGRLNKRITIERLEKRRLPSGQVDRTGNWVPVCTVWAEMRCTSVKAADSNGAIQHEGFYKFFLRRREDITAEMRVRYGSRIFTLQGPPADWKDERTGMTLVCKELV